MQEFRNGIYNRGVQFEKRASRFSASLLYDRRGPRCAVRPTIRAEKIPSEGVQTTAGVVKTFLRGTPTRRRLAKPRAPRSVSSVPEQRLSNLGRTDRRVNKPPKQPSTRAPNNTASH